MILMFWGFVSNAISQDSLVNQDIKVNGQLWLDYNFDNTIKSDKVLHTQIGYRKIYPDVFYRVLAI